jgi:hypothetical protein
VGTTEGELRHGFERIIVSLPVALIARQLLQESSAGMATTRAQVVVRLVYDNVTDYNAFPVTSRTDRSLMGHRVAFVIWGEHPALYTRGPPVALKTTGCAQCCDLL